MRFSKVYKQIVLDNSFKNWKNLLAYYFQISKAHLLMLARTEIVPKSLAKEIAQAFADLENEKIGEILPEDVEDLVFLIERKLSEKIGVEKAGFLHIARSRNDIDATIFRMCVREELIEVAEELIDLVEKLSEKAGQNVRTVLLMYTHGQPAQPSSFAHYLLSLAFDLLEVLEALLLTLRVVNACPMGSAAITTSGFKIDRKIVSDYLGFLEPVENSYRAIVTSHWISMPIGCLKVLACDLSRFAQDILHRASCEVGIFDFPDELVQISSIMPQKRNPVILEHLRIRSSVSFGLFNAVENAFLNTPYQDVNENGDLVLSKFLGGVDVLKQALQLTKEIVEKIVVDESRVKELALVTGSTTTELADFLVREFKISFRQAHEVVSEYVKSGMSYDSLVERFERLTGKKFTLTPDQVAEVLLVDNFVRVRQVMGGPGERSIEQMIRTLGTRLKSCKQNIDSMKHFLRQSLQKMQADF
ncbi:MAG: argininosuccinate lyase, partial [Pseudothermotoga sp.]